MVHGAGLMSAGEQQEAEAANLLKPQVGGVQYTN